MQDYQALRQQHVARLRQLMPSHVQRLGWSAEQLRAERESGFRHLLRVALASSPWHARRLAGIDPDRCDEADLSRIPPMTKDDLMATWDDIVTDRRLTLDIVEQHLHGLRTDAYLFGEFHAVESGGSTGRRGCSYTGGSRGRSPMPDSYARPCGIPR
jgi:hypothetical protein